MSVRHSVDDMLHPPRMSHRFRTAVKKSEYTHTQKKEFGYHKKQQQPKTAVPFQFVKSTQLSSPHSNNKRRGIARVRCRDHNRDLDESFSGDEDELLEENDWLRSRIRQLNLKCHDLTIQVSELEKEKIHLSSALSVSKKNLRRSHNDLQAEIRKRKVVLARFAAAGIEGVHSDLSEMLLHSSSNTSSADKPPIATTKRTSSVSSYPLVAAEYSLAEKRETENGSKEYSQSVCLMQDDDDAVSVTSVSPFHCKALAKEYAKRRKHAMLTRSEQMRRSPSLSIGSLKQ